MGSKKKTIGILSIVIALLMIISIGVLVYRNQITLENYTENNISTNDTSQQLTSTQKIIEDFYYKPITDEKIALDSIELNRNQLGYGNKDFSFEFESKNEYMSASYSFKLMYKGIPVNDRGISVITKSDYSANMLITGGVDFEKISKVNTTPKITQDEALNIAKKSMNIEESDLIKELYGENSAKLVIYEFMNKYNLAYCVQSFFEFCYIDAETGEIICCGSTMVSNTAEYVGQNGDRHTIFYDDYIDKNKEIKNALWDKNKNILILNNAENIYTIEDIQSGENKSAVDAMVNTYRAVEYFENHFNKHFYQVAVSVNVDKLKNEESGEIVKDNAQGGVNKIENNDVACLAFTIMSNKNKPQLSAYLDVVAHEYTHAVTDSEAFGINWDNKDSKYFERKALKEAYSDIFGELIEQEYTGKTDWKSNKDRNLKSPKIKQYSKRYTTQDKQGTDSNDYGYSHKNSTIISHTAYLMSKDNDNKKYDDKFLLDYDQLGKLWYRSLKHLKDMELKNFSDCRWAIEKSARELIEEGVLLEGNLKIIEQAFNEVGVSSDPIRHAIEKSSAIIKDKHTLIVPVETEIATSETVEITEMVTTKSTTMTTTPTEPTPQITAIDLIDKSIPEIISLMNGEYQIIQTEMGGYYNGTYSGIFYIQNQSVFPGMEFYSTVTFDESVKCNLMSEYPGEEIQSDELRRNLEAGKYALDGIQVNKSGKVSNTIQVGMDYKSCCKVLGDFDCIGGNGGYLSGSIESVSHTYNEKNAEIILHFFDIPLKILSDLTSSKISSVSSEEMKSYNPKLENVVIRKPNEIEQTEKSSNNFDISEDELKNIMSSYGNICAWEYADYDGNGMKEAFTIVGKNSMPDYYISDSIQGVYFISAKGEVKELSKISNGLMCSIERCTEYEGKKFFSYNATAGGSSSQTYLFSVKNGNCYELSISGTIVDFYNDNSKCYATISEFLPEGGHIWAEYELIYDKSSQEFSIGNDTGNIF